MAIKNGAVKDEKKQRMNMSHDKAVIAVRCLSRFVIQTNLVRHAAAHAFYKIKKNATIRTQNYQNIYLLLIFRSRDLTGCYKNKMFVAS